MLIYITVFYNENDNEFGDELEKSTLETIESIVQQLMIKQRARMKSLEETSEQMSSRSTPKVTSIITSASGTISPLKVESGKCPKPLVHYANKTSLGSKRDASTGCTMISSATLSQLCDSDVNGNPAPKQASSAAPSPKPTTSQPTVSQLDWLLLCQASSAALHTDVLIRSLARSKTDCLLLCLSLSQQ